MRHKLSTQWPFILCAFGVWEHHEGYKLHNVPQGLGIKVGEGSKGRAAGEWQLGEGAGSCHLNSISLLHYPVVLNLQPFIFMVSTSLHTAKANFLCTFYFLVCLGFSFGFLRIIELFQKKDQLVETGDGWWRISWEEFI